MYDEAEKNNILRHFKKGWDTGLGEMRHTMADVLYIYYFLVICGSKRI